MPGKFILVIGNFNTVVVIKAAKFPDSGETLSGMPYQHELTSYL